MTSPKELLSSLDTAITDYGPGDSNDCIVYMTVGQARALRSRLTAETGVRDGALEEAAKYIETARLPKLHSEIAACIRALKSPPAPKGE